MKTYLALALLAVACGTKNDKKTQPKSSLELLAESEASWQSMGHDSYVYTTGIAYEFDKKGWETSVSVESNKAVCRKFQHKENMGGTWKTTDEYIESAGSLGLHDQGFKPKTMDDLYADCESLLKSRTGVTLNFFDNGILKACYTSCDNTCYDSLSIKEIKLGSKLDC